jgi:dihydroxyacid dehydratase/phosphogluconate dehydratase
LLATGKLWIQRGTSSARGNHFEEAEMTEITEISENMRKYSSQMVDGIEAAPARAMLRAVGFTDDDFRKPQIVIASTWANVTPCNMHINKLAEEAEKDANAAGGKAVIFNTPTVWTALPTAPRV